MSDEENRGRGVRAARRARWAALALCAAGVGCEEIRAADAGSDASTDVGDGGDVARVEAGDAPGEGGPDGSGDVVSEPSADVAMDAVSDVVFDVPGDVGADAPGDAPIDAADVMVDATALDADAADAIDVIDAALDVATGTDTVSPDGAPDVSCPSGQVRCAGACVDTQRSESNCGACGVVCPAGQLCVAGACVCPGGDTLCSGACVNLASSAANCGACGRACPAGQVCSGGGCGLVCSVAGEVVCGSGASSVCANTRSSRQHCGACGRACPAVQSCVAGACECPAGQVLCGAECVTLSSDGANCGACGRSCTGGTTCVGGACVCPAGQTLCGGRCVDLSADGANCGACARLCPTGQACRGGACSIDCPAPGTRCTSGAAMSCVDTSSDELNCGSCGNGCGTPPGAGSVECRSGSCQLACATGRGNCDGAYGNGCEVDTTSSASHCGACGNACAAGRVCAGGACVCPSGTALCSGACVGLQTSDLNCGMCGNACAAGRSCVGGSCVCDAPTVLCSGACVNTQTNGAHCGGCGISCTGGRSCSAGSCICPSGIFCSGACVDGQTSNAHCGACGNACVGGQSCVSGVCRCPSGQTLCGGSCVNTQTNGAHCGSCGNACGGAQSCVAAACSCNTSGLTACGTSCVNTQSDGANCGSCGNACGAGATCRAGACDVRFTERVSVSTSGVQGNQGSFVSTADSVSSDTRYVAFGAEATNLVANDTNAENDVFVRDRVAGTTVRVSVSAAAVQGDGVTYAPYLSADGRRVAFFSLASNLVAGDTNGVFDVFRVDLTGNLVERLSVSSGGAQADGANLNLWMTPDARLVAFASAATNLVPGDTNGGTDVFLRDTTAATTTRVSLANGGAQANGDCAEPTLSADGRFLTYSSSATNAVAGDTNGVWDIFLRDLSVSPAAVSRVSVASDGTQGNGESRFQSSVSTDGRYVVFPSEATNLVVGDTNGSKDIFLRDRLTNTTTRVSVGAAGAQANGASEQPRISPDGAFVLYWSVASNLVAGDTNGVSDVFVYERSTGATSRVSVDSSGQQANGASTSPTFAGSTGYVLFSSDATNLVTGDTNGVTDVFLRRWR